MSEEGDFFLIYDYTRISSGNQDLVRFGLTRSLLACGANLEQIYREGETNHSQNSPANTSHFENPEIMTPLHFELRCTIYLPETVPDKTVVVKNVWSVRKIKQSKNSNNQTIKYHFQIPLPNTTVLKSKINQIPVLYR